MGVGAGDGGEVGAEVGGEGMVMFSAAMARATSSFSGGSGSGRPVFLEMDKAETWDTVRESTARVARSRMMKEREGFADERVVLLYYKWLSSSIMRYG